MLHQLKFKLVWLLTLKDKGVKIIKKTLYILSDISPSYFFFFKNPRTNKTVKIPGMSLRLKKVCPVYNTYPITQAKNVLANSVASVCI